MVGLIVGTAGSTRGQTRQQELDRALIAAVKRKDLETAAILLRQGANVDARDLPIVNESWWTVLMQTLRKPQQRPLGPTALLLAMSHGPRFKPMFIDRRRPDTSQEDRLFSLLLSHGADVNAPEPCYCTGNAVSLLPANVVEEEMWGKPPTPLMYAAVSGRPRLADLLLRKGAGVNACGDFVAEVLEDYDSTLIVECEGVTALHLATVMDDCAMVARLIKAHADVDAICGACEGFHGGTSLYLAVWHHNLPVIKLLLRAHCNVDTSDDRGVSALQQAAEEGEQAIYDALKRAGASGQYAVKPGGVPP